MIHALVCNYINQSCKPCKTALSCSNFSCFLSFLSFRPSHLIVHLSNDSLVPGLKYVKSLYKVWYVKSIYTFKKRVFRGSNFLHGWNAIRPTHHFFDLISTSYNKNIILMTLIIIQHSFDFPTCWQIFCLSFWSVRHQTNGVLIDSGRQWSLVFSRVYNFQLT